MQEGIKNIAMMIFCFIGCYLILGTFAFHVMPIWAITLHLICAIAFVGFAPLALEKMDLK